MLSAGRFPDNISRKDENFSAIKKHSGINDSMANLSKPAAHGLMALHNYHKRFRVNFINN